MEVRTLDLGREAQKGCFSVNVRFKLHAGKKISSEGASWPGMISLPQRLLERVNPVYPEEARKNGMQGVVILNVRSDEEGRVAQIEVLKSIPGLDQAAIEAVKQWRYEPFLKEGSTAVVFTVMSVSASSKMNYS